MRSWAGSASRHLAAPVRARAWRGCGRALAWLALAWLLTQGAVFAQDGISLERRVKAAYLLKFPGYVTWPEGVFASPDAPMSFGVIGDEQLAAELVRAAAGKDVTGRPLTVRRLREGEPLAGVHILFVAGHDNARLAQVLRAAGGQPILVVTEADGALERGSAINFMLVSDRVKFEIGIDGAERRGLKLSSRLLAVAQTVRPAGSLP